MSYNYPFFVINIDKRPYIYLHKSLEISLWKEKKTKKDTIME
jgi:hypothetical protein